jgi:hypothetical protein
MERRYEMTASAAYGARQVMQDLATGGRGVPRIIDGHHCPAATQASHAALRRRSASGYVDRHHHA